MPVPSQRTPVAFSWPSPTAGLMNLIHLSFGLPSDVNYVCSLPELTGFLRFQLPEPRFIAGKRAPLLLNLA